VREQIAASRNERDQLALDAQLQRTRRERELLEAERRVAPARASPRWCA
jgi:hypothetical protein